MSHYNIVICYYTELLGDCGYKQNPRPKNVFNNLS